MTQGNSGQDQEAWRVIERPAPPLLDTPENSVRSYLEWISYAYYTGNTDEAAAAMDIYELPRIDAYIAKLTQDNLRINQQLITLDFVSVQSQEATATVRTHEEWSYNYMNLEDLTWDETILATYENTYTVVRHDDELWYVFSVDVRTSTGVR